MKCKESENFVQRGLPFSPRGVKLSPLRDAVVMCMTWCVNWVKKWSENDWVEWGPHAKALWSEEAWRLRLSRKASGAGVKRRKAIPEAYGELHSSRIIQKLPERAGTPRSLGPLFSPALAAPNSCTSRFPGSISTQPSASPSKFPCCHRVGWSFHVGPPLTSGGGGCRFNMSPFCLWHGQFGGLFYMAFKASRWVPTRVRLRWF